MSRLPRLYFAERPLAGHLISLLVATTLAACLPGCGGADESPPGVTAADERQQAALATANAALDAAAHEPRAATVIAAAERAAAETTAYPADEDQTADAQPRLATAAANRLASGGLSHVWVSAP